MNGKSGEGDPHTTISEENEERRDPHRTSSEKVTCSSECGEFLTMNSGGGPLNGLVIDIRGFNPGLRRPMVFTIVDKMIEMDSDESLVVICDHEPAGLGYQLDLRKETRGRFEYFYDQRLDGAWVALIRKKRG